MVGCKKPITFVLESETKNIMIKENIVLYFESAIKQGWNNVAFSDYKGKDYKYSDVANQIAKLHLLFEQNGIRKGDKIALIGKNSSNWAMIFLSVVSYGAVVIPILPEFKPDDVHHIVNHSDSILLFAGDILENLDPEQMPALQAIISISNNELKYCRKENWRNSITDLDAEFNRKYTNGLNKNSFNLPEIPNNTLAEISYTSGTTGFSKGVMLLHNSLAANIRFARNNMPLKPGDKIVSFLPLAHAYGCAFEFLFPFTLGCHITFLTKLPTPQVIIKAFNEIKPKLILSVPLVIEKIYKKQILSIISKPQMRIMLRIPLINSFLYKKIRKNLMDIFGGNFYEIVVGGAAFNSEAEAFFRKTKFPFTIGYGMTECGPLISYSPWNKTKLYSAGKPVDTLEVKIDSYDPYSIAGEILLKGDNVMVGYYKNEAATKNVIDQDGWLHTGDQGIIDKDNNIYIKGRSKTMILGASGQNIYPEEIESLLNNRECIMESLIIEENGRLIALLYPDYDCIENKQYSSAEMNELFGKHIKEVNNKLPNYMNISRFVIHTSEFEKTPKRSIKRYLYNSK